MLYKNNILKETTIIEKIKLLVLFFVITLIAGLSINYVFNQNTQNTIDQIKKKEQKVKNLVQSVKEDICKSCSLEMFLRYKEGNKNKIDIKLFKNKIKAREIFFTDKIEELKAISNKNKNQELLLQVQMLDTIKKEIVENSNDTISRYENGSSLKNTKTIDELMSLKNKAISISNEIIKEYNQKIDERFVEFEELSKYLMIVIVFYYVIMGALMFLSGYSIVVSIEDSTKSLGRIISSISLFVRGVERCIPIEEVKNNHDEIGRMINMLNKIVPSIERSFNYERETKKSIEKSFKAVSCEMSTYIQAFDELAIITKTDLDGKITYANKLFYKTTGYSVDECIGKTHKILKDDTNDPKIYENLWNTITKGEKWNGIISNLTKDGKRFWVQAVISPITDADGNKDGYISVKMDVTESQILNREIIETQKDLIFEMGKIGESRSKETGNHVKRVAEYSKLMAQLYGLSDHDVEIIYNASPMHDIGKVAIEDSILKKPGKLTDEERRIMNTHAELGYNMLKNSNREILRAAAKVAHEHHEKWAGGGYPRGIKGKEIHVFARITALCDVFDALGSDRVYKKAWEMDRVLKLIQEESGKSFEPRMVELFFENLDQFIKIKDTYTDDFEEEATIFE